MSRRAISRGDPILRAELLRNVTLEQRRRRWGNGRVLSPRRSYRARNSAATSGTGIRWTSGSSPIAGQSPDRGRAAGIGAFRWKRQGRSANPPLLAFEDIAPKLGIHHLNATDGGVGRHRWRRPADHRFRERRLHPRLSQRRRPFHRSRRRWAAKVPSLLLNLIDYDNDGWPDLTSRSTVERSDAEPAVPQRPRQVHQRLREAERTTRFGFVSLWAFGQRRLADRWSPTVCYTRAA